MKIVSAKSTDGIHYKGLLSEPSSNAKGIIIHIHGMSGSIVLNEYYSAMHTNYRDNGWAFLVPELRGSGAVTQYNSDNGGKNLGNAFEIFEECIFDIQGWINFALELGYTNMWLQSHSLGTSKAAYYLNQSKDSNVKGLIFLSPSDMVGLVHDAVGIKDHEVLFPEAKQLVKDGKGTQFLSNKLWGDNIISANTYINFFGEGAKDAIFNFENPSLGWDVVNSLNVPVLAISGTLDDGIVPVMDVYKAMEILEKELKNSPKKKTIVYKDAEHSFDGFEEQITQDVLAFINS